MEKDHASLVKLSEEVARVNEFTPWHYVQYVLALYTLGLRERGEGVMDEALEIYPEDLSLRIRHAENAMFSDRSVAASRWQHIISSFKHYPEGVYWRLADAHIRALKFKEARNTAKYIESTYGGSQRLNDLNSTIDSAEAKRYILKTSKSPSGTKFHLKDPKDKKFGKIKDFQNYRLRGWVKIPEGKNCSLVLKNNKGKETRLEFNKERQDIKERFQGEGEHNIQLQCGFDHTVSLVNGATLSLLVEGEQEWLAQLELRGILSVLEGKEGWLFLDNDANESVNLFTGKTAFTEAMRSAWESYADELLAYQEKFNLVYFVANAKEAVREQDYPYPKAENNVVDQVKGLLQKKGVNLVSPTEQLANKEGTYYKTDTHWSDYGAYLGYQSIMEKCGFENPIKDISFEETEVVGDLGSKLQPKRKSMKKVHVYKGA